MRDMDMIMEGNSRERYLVTSAGGDIGSSVIRCLMQEVCKENLLGCDITPYDVKDEEVDEFFCVPSYTDEVQYIDVLLNKCREREITHILPMTEEEIIIFDKHRTLFTSAGIKVMIQESNILEAMISKYNISKTIKKMGLASPETWWPEETVENINYPLLIRSDHGYGSKDVTVVHNRQEYEVAVSKIPSAVIQEYIKESENEYTVIVFSNGQKVITMVLKQTLGFDGMSQIMERMEDPQIDQIAETVAHHFKLRGSINIQIRKQKDQYYILEINPMISNTVGFCYELGFKYVKWWLDLLDGRQDKIDDIPEPLPMVGIRTSGQKIFRNNLDLERKFELYSQKKEQKNIGGGLLLSNNPLSVLLYEWISEQGITVTLYSDKLTVSMLRQLSPAFVISYNYRHIVSKEVIQYYQREIINLHISYLPWNRGSNPNVWSFITDTPKGITIHCIDEGLDSGDILIQKQVWFDEHRETFESTYDALNDLILLTLEENWDRIINHQIARIPQQEGIGSSHTVKEFEEFLNGRNIDWKENISMFKQRMKINKKFS